MKIQKCDNSYPGPDVDDVSGFFNEYEPTLELSGMILGAYEFPLDGRVIRPIWVSPTNRFWDLERRCEVGAPKRFWRIFPEKK